MSLDFNALLERQRQFSLNAFGPGGRQLGVADHIKKELDEIEATPFDGEEWADVILLSLDGAWRTGSSSDEVLDALEAVRGVWPRELDRPVGASAGDVMMILRQVRYESLVDYGPRDCTERLCASIRQNLDVIAADQEQALSAWLRIFLLALDGAWRASPYVADVPVMVLAKLEKNESREWQDWRSFSQDVAIEHIRSEPTNTSGMRAVGVTNDC